MEFTINIEVSGDYTEQDLKDYLRFCLGFGSISQDNPFINEGSDVEITDIELI